jgi:hypothetical protein
LRFPTHHPYYYLFEVASCLEIGMCVVAQLIFVFPIIMHILSIYPTIYNITPTNLPFEIAIKPLTSVACAVGPSVNPLQIRKLNMWTLFCNVCIDFLNSQIWKEIMLEFNGKPSSVTTFSTEFSFQNLSKSYQIDSIKFRSSRSFQ